MKAAHRLMGLSHAAYLDVSYGACDDHRPYATKAEARRAGKRHVRAWQRREIRCRKCRAGLVPNLFKCVHHWHWGHKRPRPREDEMANEQPLAEERPVPDEQAPMGNAQFEGLVQAAVQQGKGLVNAASLEYHDTAIAEAQRRRDKAALRQMREGYEELAKRATELAQACR